MEWFVVEDVANHVLSFVHWNELQYISLVSKSFYSLIQQFKQHMAIQLEHQIFDFYCIGPFILHRTPHSLTYRESCMPRCMLRQWNDSNCHTFWQQSMEDSWYYFALISTPICLVCFKKVLPEHVVWKLPLENLYITQLNQDLHNLFVVCQSSANHSTKVMVIRKWDGTVLTDLIRRDAGIVVDCWVLHNDTVAVLYQPQATHALFQQIFFFKKCRQNYELFYTMDCNNLHSFTIQGLGFMTSPNYYRIPERVLALDGRPSFQNAIVLQLLCASPSSNSVTPFIHTIFCEYNFQVLFSKCCTKFWLFYFYDVSKRSNSIRLLNIATHQVYHCKHSTAFILVEELFSGNCVGFVEPLQDHICYIPFASNCVPFDTTTQSEVLPPEQVYRIDVPNLPLFHTIMFVEGYLIPKTTIAVVALAGDKGCHVFAFDTAQHATLWSKIIVAKSDEIPFSAFDITMQCRMIGGIDISLLVTIKGHGFFHEIVRCTSGEVVHQRVSTWEKWSNEIGSNQGSWEETVIQEKPLLLTSSTKHHKQCSIN